LRELAEYPKITGTAMFLRFTAKNSSWVRGSHIKQYKLQGRRKTSYITTSEFDVEELGFEWDRSVAAAMAAWEHRLSELADYRKIQGTVMFNYTGSQAG
jgi:hypothetical protein